jgi:hypothetical protein
MMEQKDAEFIRPLLEAQPYIRSVEIIKKGEPLPTGFVELDGFRRNMQSIIGREIRTWYYPPGPVLPGEYERTVLSVEEPTERVDKVAICFTPRYRAGFDVNVLHPYHEQLVFVGLPDEHAEFSRRNFPIEYHPVENALELLRFLASCRGFIGNVSGVFALAECAKIRRVLCLAKDRGNVRVYGNGREASNQNELKTIFNEMR